MNTKAAGGEGHQSGEDEVDGDGVAEVAAIAQQLSRRRQQAGAAEMAAAVRRIGFRQQPEGGSKHDNADAAEEDEGGTPAEPCLQVAADDRRQCRRNRKGGANHRHRPCCSFRAVDVADDGAAEDRADARRHALQHPTGNQGADRWGQGAPHRGAEIKAEPGQQGRPPAAAIGDGSERQLAKGKAGEKAGEGEVDPIRRGREVVDDRRHRRNVDGGRDLPQGHQCRQQRAEGEGGARLHRFKAAPGRRPPDRSEGLQGEAGGVRPWRIVWVRPARRTSIAPRLRATTSAPRLRAIRPRPYKGALSPAVCPPDVALVRGGGSPMS
ncbi:MAG: hypothetical protein U1E43_06805 [Rhodospirillales bacterium]